MRLLQERDSSDSELLAYAVTLINKTLHGLPDQDSYYDQIEYLEGLGMQQIVSRYVLSVIALCEFETSGFFFFRFVSKPDADSDLIQQLEIYELQLKQEDEEPCSDYSNQHRYEANKYVSLRELKMIHLKTIETDVFHVIGVLTADLLVIRLIRLNKGTRVSEKQWKFIQFT